MGGVRAVLPWGVGVAIILVSCRRIIAHAFNLLDLQESAYRYGILAPNYFEEGFVRRGLSSTLYALTELTARGSSIDGLMRFHIVSAVWLAIPVTLLLHRLARTSSSWIWFALVLMASPQTLLAWSRDVGRPDMFAIGFIVWALLAALSGRYVIAAAVLAVGYLAHEVAVIYGAPLLLAVWYLDFRAGRASRLQLGRSTALLAIALAFLGLGQWLFTAEQSRIVAVIVDSGPPSLHRDMAAYMTVSGLRSITTSLCQTYGRSATPFLLAANLAVVLAYLAVFLATSRRAALLHLFVALAPMIAISLIAIDYGRWVALAVMNAWLAAVALRVMDLGPPAPSRRTVAVAAVVLAALLVMRPSRVYEANEATRNLSILVWGKDGAALRSMDACHPGWRAAVGIPP